MTADTRLRLAHRGHAQAIAALSRDRIERGLGWSWTARRVVRSMADADTNVLVALDASDAVCGFAIMKFGDDEAHLLLLAVQAEQGRRGIGSAMVGWLEAVAGVAGVRRIFLEAREANGPARAFYRRLGYREIELLPGYYQGREDSVRLLKDLWENAGVTPRSAD
jgi:ribosomal-protein-alanine N-acetyltransferase